MIDVELIGNQAIFHKQLWHTSEVFMAKCFCFNVDDNKITCNLAVTSSKALRSFIEFSFKNFSESYMESERRNKIYEDVNTFYQQRDAYIDSVMQQKLPYYGKLYAHQKEVLCESFYKQHNFYAMEMGTGKTLTSASMSRMLGINCTLIVCPAAVKFNWFRDLVKFGFNELYFTMLDSTKRRTFRAFQERFIVINYDILSNFYGEILTKNIGHFIFDEAAALKNHLSGRAKITRKIIDHFPKARITFLSGTPITNRVNDVFSYLKMTGNELGHSHKKFLEEYTVSTNGRGGSRVTGGRNLQDLHVKLSNFMIRKTKADCLDLPEKIYFSYKFELDDYREEYNKIIKEMSDAKELSRLTGNLHSLNIIASKAKKKGIIALAQSILDEGRKVVIFGNYKEPLNEMQKHFEGCCTKIDGAVDSYQRDQNVQKFIKDPKCTVFLGNMIAAGVGINLTNASDVIFMEFPLVPSSLYQATDRLHRIGATESVNVHYTICEDSIDQYIYDLLIDKSTDINTVIDQGKEVMMSENFNEILIKKLLHRDDIIFKNPHAKAVVEAPQEEVEETTGHGNENTQISSTKADDGKRMLPKYYLVSHPESSCIFIQNQNQRDSDINMGDGLCVLLFEHENIDEIIKEGRHQQMLRQESFNENFEFNGPTIKELVSFANKRRLDQVISILAPPPDFT